jgi:GAF domain-containing protein
VEQNAIPLVITSLRGRVLYANPAAAQRLGSLETLTLPHRSGVFARLEPPQTDRHAPPLEISRRAIQWAGRRAYLITFREPVTPSPAEADQQQALLREQKLHAITQVISSSLDLQTTLHDVVRLSAELVEADGGVMGLLEPDGQHLSIASGYNFPINGLMARLPRGRGVVWDAVDAQRGLWLPVYRAHPQAQHEVAERLGVQALLAVPLVTTGRCIGVLQLISRRAEHTFSPRDLTLAEAVGQQAAVAIENSRLFEAQTQTLIREQRLNALTHLVSQTLDLEVILQDVVRLSAELVNAQGGIVGLLTSDERHLQLVYVYNLPAAHISPLLPKGEGLAWEVIESQRGLIVPDYPRHPQARPGLIAHGVTAYIMAPIIANERSIGALQLTSHTHSQRFTERDLALLEAIGRQAGVAIEKARLLAAAQQQASELASLYGASVALYSATELAHVAEQIVNVVVGDFAHAHCALLLIDETGQHLRPIAQQSQSGMQFQSFPLRVDGPGLIAAAARERRVIYAPDVRLEPRYLEGYPNTRSEIAIPLRDRDKALGVLNLESEQIEAFSESDRRVLIAFAERAELAIRSALLFEDAQQNARHLRLLHALAQIALGTHDFQVLLDTLADQLPAIINADSATITIWDAANQITLAGGASASVRPIAATAQPIPGEPTVTASVVRLQRTLVEDDLSDSPYVSRRLIEAFRVKAYVATPLLVSGQSLGAIILMFHERHHFSAQEIARTEQAAAQVALAVQNGQLFSTLERNAQHVMRLNQMTQVALQGLALDELLHLLADHLTAVIQADHGTISLWDTATNSIVRSGASASIRAVDDRLTLEPGELTVTPLVLKVGRTIVDEDAALGRYMSPRIASYFGTRAYLAIPLVAGEQLIGSAILSFERPHHFTVEEIERAEQAAGQIALAVANSQLLSRLEQARDVAEEANRLKSEFLANTSHELRTPLSGILGSLKLILDDMCDSPAEERDFIRAAYDASRKLLDIINDLLDVARIEAGKVVVHPEPVDVTALLLEIYQLTRVQAEQKALTMSIELPPNEAPLVSADPGKTRQILINLIGNALKFTERGSVRVTVEPEVAQHRMLIRVIDTGIGIAPETQQRLFQPFVQADGSTTRRYGGTGLGLSISRRLAELMGGTLTLYSAGRGHGSTFTLALPLMESR